LKLPEGKLFVSLISTNGRNPFFQQQRILAEPVPSGKSKISRFARNDKARARNNLTEIIQLCFY
jgi:hypothetical protein